MNDARPSNFRLSWPRDDCDTGEWTAANRTVESFEASYDLDSRSVVIPNPFGRYAIDRLLAGGALGLFFSRTTHLKQRGRESIPPPI